VNDTSGNINSTIISITVQDTTSPSWIQSLSNQSVEYGSSFSYDVNATDAVTLDKYYLNDTTNFTINSTTGLITNNTGLLLNEVYSLNISVNDTSGNILSSIISITVQDTTAPTWVESISNQVVTYGNAFSYDVNATDNVNISTYYIGDTTNFTINSSTGLITNNTQLNITVYYLNISVNDTLGNILSEVIQVTVQEETTQEEEEEEDDDDDSTSTSRSSRGWETVSSPDVEHVSLWEVMEEGESKVLVKKEEIPITEIIMKIKNKKNNVKITVKKYTETPSGIKVPYKKPIYRYMEIKKQNIDNEDLANVKIKFKVAKPWLAEQGIDQENVVLLKYSGDNEWLSLSTEKTNSNDNFVFYTAITSGFSYFAIAEKIIEEVPEQEIVEEPIEEVTPQEEPVIEQKQTTQEPPITQEPPVTKEKPLWLRYILLVILFSSLVVAALMFYYKKPKNKDVSSKTKEHKSSKKEPKEKKK
jgi:PGF-pre-PGF domain-containing protein